MPNINKNIIMQAGAAVANATNKAAGLSAATPEPGSSISVIQLVNGGRTIGPDALAHFTESVRNKLLSLLVSMEPIQDFNGYGHPWPAGGGKNLFDCDTTVQAYINASGNEMASPHNAVSDYILLKPNTDYCISCNQIMANIGKCIFNDTKTSVLSRLDHNNVQSVVISSSPNTRYLRTWINANNSTPMTVAECKKYEPQVEAGNTRTSFSPYSNICPISGRTGLHVYAGPTSAIGDAATHSMDWTSPAGTVYAGSADIVSGDIKAAPYYASYDGETLVGPWVSSMDVYDPDGTPTTGAQVVDLGGTMTEYHITGQDIITLVGDNYIWSDSGDVTITE